VRVTVARPKLSPASHQLVILLKMSRTSVTSAIGVLLTATGRTAEHIPDGIVTATHLSLPSRG
jgi:hypothetical protein